jgi:hypothetical protein
MHIVSALIIRMMPTLNGLFTTGEQLLHSVVTSRLSHIPKQSL